MPGPRWTPTCGCQDILTDGFLRCPDCGAPRRFYGHSFSMIERMGRYQHIFGVAPVGPHRSLTDELLAPLRSRCGRCRGEGFQSWGEKRWSYCWACEADGGFWTRSPATLRAVRQKVVDRFPSWTQPDFPRKGWARERGIERLPPPARDQISREERTRAQTGRAHPSRVLVHGPDPLGESVVFASLEWAWGASRVHEALRASESWGEFRGRVERRTRKDFFRSIGREGVRRPDEAPFDPAELGLAPDAPPPPWLQLRQVEFLPVWFLDRFGRVERPAGEVPNGRPAEPGAAKRVWRFNPAQVDEMVETLRMRFRIVVDVEEAGGLTLW